MSTVTKVFIAGTIGSFVATWAEPKIVAKLPDSLKSPTAAKVTHAAIAGGAAAFAYYGLAKLGVTS